MATTIPQMLLFNPIWHALSTSHAHFAEGNDRAKRYPPAVTPLAATRDQSLASYDSLAQVMQPGTTAGLLAATPSLLSGRWTILHERKLSQMVWSQITAVEKFPYEDLNSSHAEEMLALVELTKPGPFGRRTWEMGSYIGIHRDGQLVAMAGERLRLPGYTEVSAVCTHPEHRGLGYATSLVSTLIRKIIERNEIPFLHVAADNIAAISVYEKLGFKTRCIIDLAVVRRESAELKVALR